MREPEDERNAERTHERGGEHGVDRAHVRDDGTSPQTAELARQRSLEAGTASRLVTGSEGTDAAVRRQHALDRVVRENDDLVDELGQGADLRDGGRERGMRRVDLLRDEDELGHG